MFISFEGGEGSGKTTLIKKLAEHFRAKGHVVHVAREPGGSAVSEKIRNLLLDSDSEITPKAELLLYLAARAQHLDEKIAPALNAGAIVLCDRFNDSTVAYQGYARGLGADLVQNLCNQVTGEMQPQITFFLDIAPEKGLARSSGKPDRIEKESLRFHEKVREGYQQLAANEPQRIYTLDAEKSAETVFNEALKTIETALGRRV